MQTDIAMPSCLLFSDTFPMRWGDMDALGHLNNTLYFRYFEQSRVAWLEAAGFPVSLNASSGPILAATQCDFFKPLVYPADIRVDTWVKRIGRSSFSLGHRVMLASVTDPTQAAAEGEAVIVWVDYGSGQSMALPANLRQLLEATTAASGTDAGSDAVK